MEWRPIPGHQNVYEISEDGHVRNTLTGHVLKPGQHPGGYWAYQLGYLGGEKRHVFAHRLVAAAFLTDPGDSEVVRHLDDDPGNNHWSNLAYGTHADNRHDSVRNGGYRNQNTRKPTCKNGHDFTAENTTAGGKGERLCLTCTREWRRELMRRKRNTLAADVGGEACELDGCELLRAAKGLCLKHYDAMRKQARAA